MPAQLCKNTNSHGPHEWYWKNILRRECPGLIAQPCGRPDAHLPHWYGECRDELCHGDAPSVTSPNG